MRSTTFCILALFGAIWVTSTARGEDWRVDVSGGALVPTSEAHLSESAIGRGPLNKPGDARFDAGGSYAVGASYVLTDHVELGGQFQHSLSRHVDRVTVPGRFPASVPSGLNANPSLDVFSITLGTRLHLLAPDHRVRPWVIGQVGWYRAEADVDERTLLQCSPDCPGTVLSPNTIHRSGTDDGFGFNVGGGVDVRLTRLLSVGADIRYHRTVNVLDDLNFVTTMLAVSLHF